jgi:hypothetical protein
LMEVRNFVSASYTMLNRVLQSCFMVTVITRSHPIDSYLWDHVKTMVYTTEWILQTICGAKYEMPVNRSGTQLVFMNAHVSRCVVHMHVQNVMEIGSSMFCNAHNLIKKYFLCCHWCPHFVFKG